MELVSLEDSTAHYDIHGDGYRYHLSWVAPDDGLLAYDLDGDGRIAERGEISFVDYVEGARTDLEGLRHFDTNGDGVLDSADREWSKFRVWQDLDQDGESDPGEVRTLDEAFVRSVSLSASGEGETREDGTRIFGRGRYVSVHGGEPLSRELLDVSLSVGRWGFRETRDGVETRRLGDEGQGSGFVAGSDEGVTHDLGASGHSLAVGGEGDDVLYNASIDWRTSGGRDVTLMGLGGKDSLYGGKGDDVVSGGSGDDRLIARGGADSLDGGSGDDFLRGGWGDDVYTFSGRGFGRDTIRERDTNGAGEEDTIVFSGGTRWDELWFSRTGSDLVIGLVGTQSRVTVEDWFAGASRKVETVVAGDRSITAAGVSQLVETMAGMSAPASGQVTLSVSDRRQMGSALAAWQELSGS